MAMVVTFSNTCYGNFVFDFEYTVYGNQVVSFEFKIVDPLRGTVSDFEAVADGQGTITFCCIVGGISKIVAKDNLVSFEIGIGDSAMQLAVPFALCQRALIESFHERQLLEENSDDETDE